MRRFFAVMLAATALAGGAATNGSAAPTVAITAKTCGHGYVHGVIGGQQKCLRRGEFCSHRYGNQYHRYGFNCVLLRPSDTYHLEPRN
jgi:hypothetical protein